MAKIWQRTVAVRSSFLQLLLQAGEMMTYE
jgi:hypothetical protein